ncbi:MAG: methanogenesis marker 12 protein [Methanosphaera sp.]|uniref:methanogenesis marker 12 protein n=1 Tax=Methanosphaera sp. TaxID=2666342 RepID=UPI0025F4756D|nr:methanogenesis marker 12 protein [Methanosphaera sp.]MCI5866729.1 methanogenesis marker 12 protein [Methanosphaera sp.]MDD6534244.1 methanogenesis marker 12 protein [Methanosphaera sp.]MDY3956372.1 methanogenesis marker 12 protein [Methanosphaera sp.]
MGYYVGMDHSTTAVSFQILDEDGCDAGFFKLARDKLACGDVTFYDEITKFIDIDDINLLCMTYSMGDDLTEITPLGDVKERGIKSINGIGKRVGGGSKVYEDIERLGIKTVMLPGLHRDCKWLDERFRLSYSHCASAEKVSLSYYAYKQTGFKNMIIADISSNTVSILVEDGKIRGAIDACLGAMGFIHGPIDLEMMRQIDAGLKTSNECFSHAGVSKIAGVDSKVTKVKDEIISKAANGDKDALVAIDCMVMSIVMEIYGLYGISKKPVDGIILTGSGGCMRKPIDIAGMISDQIKDLAEVKIMTSKSCAIGSAYIAYDIAKNNYDNIMGINVRK